MYVLHTYPLLFACVNNRNTTFGLRTFGLLTFGLRTFGLRSKFRIEKLKNIGLRWATLGYVAQFQIVAQS